MTDADVDGSHIRTLLLTFFFRQMQELIQRGRIFIAQPPLYLISRGKHEEYVLNERGMNDVLANIGLDGSSLLVRDVTSQSETGAEEPAIVRTIEGEELKRVVRQLRRLAELVEIVERRGVPFVDLLATRDNDPTGEGQLPSHRITWHEGDTSHEVFAFSEAHVQEILKRHNLEMDDLDAAIESGDGARRIATVRELHENKELATIFTELAAAGLDIDDYALVHEEAVTGEKLPTKYAWRTNIKSRKASDDGSDGESEEPSGKIVDAANIPSILTTLLDVGRRGMEVKRFKGLGEMDPEQLWETTMDSSKRTLLRVNWEDATAAEELFSTLMGENVEERRAYIERHALEVKQLDV